MLPEFLFDCRDTQKDKGLLAAGENIDYYAIVSFPPHPVDSIPIQESSHKTACEECTKEAAILKSMLDGGYDVRNCFPYTFELLPQLLLQAQGSKKAHSKVKPFCAAEEYINGQLKENITDQFYSSVVPTKPSSSTLMEASELVDPFAHGIEAHLSNASSFRHRLGKEESTKLVIDLTPEQLRSLKDPASEKLDVAVKGAILASMSSGKTDSMKAGAVSVASLEEAQRVKAERKAMVEKALQLCFLSHTEAKDALCALVKLAAPCLIRVTNCGALLSSIADAYMSSKPVIRDLLTPVQNPARKSVVGYKVLPNWRDLLRDNISSLREAISANLKAVGPVDDKTHVAHAPQDSSQRFLGSNKVVAKKGEVDDVVRHDYRQPLQHEEEEVEQQAEGPWLGDDDGGDQEQETYGIMKSGHRRGNLGKRSHSSAANNNYTAGVTNSRPQQILAPASSLSPSVHLPPPPLPPPGCPLMVCIREGVEESAISAEDEEGKDSFSARPAAIAATEDRCVNIRDVVLKEGTLLLLQHPMHTKKLARQFNKDTVAEYSHKVESDDDAFFVGRLSMGDGIWSSKLRIPLLYFQVVPAVEDSNLTVDDEEFSPGV